MQSGIILTSSFAGNLVAPETLLYCATKAFEKYLALAVNREHSSAGKQIDVMALQPGFVKTKMIKEAEETGVAFGVIPVEACVSAALRDLGYEEATYGANLHELISEFLTFWMRYFPAPSK